MSTPINPPPRYLQLPDNEWEMHDLDTLKRLRSNQPSLRVLGVNAPEMADESRGVMQAPGAVESRQAAFDYFTKNGVQDIQTYGMDQSGKRQMASINGGDYQEAMVEGLHALPFYIGDSAPLELRHRLDAARERGLAAYKRGDLNPTMKAYKSVPVNPHAGAIIPDRQMRGGTLLGNAISRGTDVMQGDLYGAGHAVASAINAPDSVTGWMKEGIDRNEREAAMNPARYNSFHDIKGVGDLLPFAAEKAAESIPSMLPMAVGGLAGAAGKTVLGRAAASVSKKALATAGATAAGAVPHLGEIEQDQMKLDQPASFAEKAGGALINSALDVFGVSKGLDQFLGAKKYSGMMNTAKQLAQSLGITSLTEAGTESLQQLVQLGIRAEHDPNFNPLTDPKDFELAKQELLEAGIAGGAAGGLMGVAGRAGGIARESLRNEPSGSDTDQTNALDSSAHPGAGTLGAVEAPSEQSAAVSVDSGLQSSPLSITDVAPYSSEVAPGVAGDAPNITDGVSNSTAITPTWDNMVPGQLVTLYRGESADNNPNGDWWTTSAEKAAKYGRVQSITIRSDELQRLAARGHGGADEFVLPRGGTESAPSIPDQELNAKSEALITENTPIGNAGLPEVPRSVKAEDIPAMHPVWAATHEKYKGVEDYWKPNVFSAADNTWTDRWANDHYEVSKKFEGGSSITKMIEPNGAGALWLSGADSKGNPFDIEVAIPRNARGGIRDAPLDIRVYRDKKRVKVSDDTLKSAFGEEFYKQLTTQPSDADWQTYVQGMNAWLLGRKSTENAELNTNNIAPNPDPITLNPDPIAPNADVSADVIPESGIEPGAGTGIEPVRTTAPVTVDGPYQTIESRTNPVEDISDARILRDEAAMANRLDTADQLNAYTYGPDGIGSTREATAPHQNEVTYVAPDKRVVTDQSKAVYAKESTAKKQLAYVARSLMSDAEKDTPVSLTRIADGRIVAVPDGETAEQYMGRNQWAEVVPTEGGYTVRVNTASGFNEIAANGGTTGLHTMGKLGPTTIKSYLDKTSSDTRLNADEGFRNPWGGNNQIDAMRVTKFGAELDNGRLLSGAEAVRDAFLRGVGEIMAAGGTIPVKHETTSEKDGRRVTREVLDLPSNLVVFKGDNGKIYRWKDIRDLKSTSRNDYGSALDLIQNLEGSTKSPKETMMTLYDVIRNSDRSVQNALSDVQSKLRNDLFKMLPYDEALAFVDDVPVDTHGAPLEAVQVTRKHNFRSADEAVREASRTLVDYMQAIGMETGTGEGFEGSQAATTHGRRGVTPTRNELEVKTSDPETSAGIKRVKRAIKHGLPIAEGDRKYVAKVMEPSDPAEELKIKPAAEEYFNLSDLVVDQRRNGIVSELDTPSVQQVKTHIQQLDDRITDITRQITDTKDGELLEGLSKNLEKVRDLKKKMESQVRSMSEPGDSSAQTLGGMDNPDIFGESDYEDGGFAPSVEGSITPVIKTGQPKSRINDEAPDPTIIQKRKPETAPRETVSDAKPMDHTDDRVTGFLRDVAKSLGIKTKFHIVSEKNVADLIKAYEKKLAKLRASTPDGVVNPDVVAMENVIQALTSIDVDGSANGDTGARIIFNDGYSKTTDRIPIIYVPGTRKGRSQARVISEAAHEFGHLIKRVALDQLIAEAKTDDKAASLLQDIFGNVDWNDESAVLLADEQFANMVKKWALTHAVPRNAIEKFFKGIGEQLRKLYNKAKAMFTSAEDRKQFGSLEKFLESMIKRAEIAPATSLAKQYQSIVDDLVLNEFADQSSGPMSRNWTAQEFVDKAKRSVSRSYNWSLNKPLLGTTAKVFKATADIVGMIGPHVRGVVPILNDLHPALAAIASQYHVMPGTTAPPEIIRIKLMKDGTIKPIPGIFRTIPIEMRQLRAEINDDGKSIDDWLTDAIQTLPKITGLDFLKPSKRKANLAKYREIGNELLEYTTNQRKFDTLSDAAKAQAEYYAKIVNRFVDKDDYSVFLQKRKQYFPLVIDRAVWDAKSVEIIDVLMRKENMSAKQAAEVVANIAESHGILDPSLIDTVLPPGMAAKHSRVFSSDTQAELAKLGVYSVDLHHIAQSYTHQIIKRAVEQTRFGDYERDDNGGYVFDLDDQGRQRYVFDPMGKINYVLRQLELNRALGNKRLSHEDMKMVREKYLPALQGRLGGNIDPRVNAIMDWTMLALNFVMLPLSVTSQLPDMAGIATMKGASLLHPLEMMKDMKQVAKTMLSSGYRKELADIARLTGSINSRLVESVLAESMADEYMTPTVKRLNETFFELIQMKRFTDFSRILATGFAVDSLKGYAGSLNTKHTQQHMQELSLTDADLKAWLAAGAPTDTKGLMQHAKIKAAIAQWVDMSILRPDAAIKPYIGSDPRFKLFWQLKTFMYSFYYTTMHRAYANMKDDPNFAYAMPALSLAVFSATLAMVGYELRKMLAEEIIPGALGVQSKYKKAEGEDLFWESFDRAGLMGPFAIMYDMYNAEKRGSLAISSLLGPAFSKSVDFMDKDLPVFVANNIPVVAQSASLRAAVTPELRGILPDRFIGE